MTNKPWNELTVEERQRRSLGLPPEEAPTDEWRRAVEAMQDTLVKCAERFREYEASHAAKGSLDGDVKARRNCEMAEMCERALPPPSRTMARLCQLAEQKHGRGAVNGHAD